MATIKKKYSDNGRTHLLKTTSKTAQSDAANGDNFVGKDTIKEIDVFLPDWIAKQSEINLYLSVREKEVREKNIALVFLKKVVRDIWEVEKRRQKRLGLPIEVLTYYQLPLNGIVPKALNEKDLLATAAKMIEGDKKAVLSGFEPILNPSAAELKEALVAAEKELGEVTPADRNFDKAEEAVSDLRPKADSLIHDVVDELNFNLRKRDNASKRRIILTYGVEIDYNSGSTPENDDEPIE